MKYISLMDKQYDVSYKYSVSEELFNKVKSMAEAELKENQEIDGDGL